MDSGLDAELLPEQALRIVDKIVDPFQGVIIGQISVHGDLHMITVAVHMDVVEIHG